MADEITLELARSLLPKRRPGDHKGTYGHLYVIAGSRGLTGAAKLASLAGLRSGAGLVTAGVPHSLLQIIAPAFVEVMTDPLPSTEDDSIAFDALAHSLRTVKDKQAAVIGPGMSRNSSTVHFISDFCQRCPVPFVVDADGLNALSENLAVLREKLAPCILTPHPGEMSRLVQVSTKEVQADRERVAKDFAQTHDCVLVLKGERTVVAGPKGEIAINTTGNEGMATGGTGDVLAGLTGGLLAQGLAPFDAARLAVFVHGLAGDVAAERHGKRAMIAGDVIDALGEAFRRIEG